MINYNDKEEKLWFIRELQLLSYSINSQIAPLMCRGGDQGANVREMMNAPATRDRYRIYA